MSINNQRSFFFNVDWLTVLLYLALCTIGWFNIHAAVFDEKHPSIIDASTNYGKQFIYINVSIVVAIVILLLESRFLTALAPAFYGITVLLLILVLVVGRNVGGNQAWINIGGGFRLQPSEFAKFSTCLLLARYLSSVNIKVTELKSFLIAAAIIGFPMLLIMLQPDTGSTLVFCSLIFVLYREGLSPYFLVISGLLIVLFVVSLLYNPLYVVLTLVIIAALIIFLFRKHRQLIFTMLVGLAISVTFIFCVKFIYSHVLKPHQTERINILLGITTDLRGKGYNVNQSKIAIGSGKLWGKGYLHGTQTKYAFVPEQSTDFIFCTVGEEWGFAGSVVVIGLYLFLILRVIYLAERQRSPFSRIYGYGVASVLFFHVVINIGMTIGIVPVIGIPLPFISYGGSSLLSFTILLFILVKLDSNRMGIV
ncbi:rod shape determining protein RodA [Mucilaginibacter lappiensis]|uniref:Cell wall polymerase n=1 Tax=Mucilaginibacter lappiensis TaxID=354630 RepID=A0A1N7FT27_9SPHI|nr:rod shape-determining protein RodA [Mucilaginibacter lappiensis]MBB6112591.1 rod shape determining protein RodA [Mucilaginibacter lappiensis]MBB6129172.1 rod shape determining protein RodA [Mucilaginibacter lappiensis]SIS03499.1 rod shape determining protein RodA [Mucilaginibacter lappiensis]